MYHVADILYKFANKIFKKCRILIYPYYKTSTLLSSIYNVKALFVDNSKN